MLTTGQRKCQLLLAIKYLASIKPYHREADLLFKQYYSKRLTLTPKNHLEFLNKLAPKPFNEQDHRWVSLTQNVQKNLKHYSMMDWAYLLKALVDRQSQTELVERLVEEMEEKIEYMSVEVAVVMLWCVGRMNSRGNIRNALLIGLFQRIKTAIGVGREEAPQLVLIHSQRHNQLKQQQKQQSEQINQLEQIHQQSSERRKYLTIHPNILTMLFTGMSSLSISDPQLIRQFTRTLLVPNLSSLSTTTLCIFLVALDRLGMRNQRITYRIYQQVRSRPEQLQKDTVSTLMNLAQTTAKLYHRNLSQNEQSKLQKYQDERQQKQEEMRDTQQFYLWLCQTILLKQQKIKCQQAALLLLHAGKIGAYDGQIWNRLTTAVSHNVMEAKVVDLVMILSSIARLSNDKRQLLNKEEHAVSVRLWQLEGSISGKSEAVLAELARQKRVRPPAKIAERLQEYALQIERAKQAIIGKSNRWKEEQRADGPRRDKKERKHKLQRQVPEEEKVKQRQFSQLRQSKQPKQQRRSGQSRYDTDTQQRQTSQHRQSITDRHRK